MVFSLDAQRMRWQHTAEGRGLVLWFPIWSRLAFGAWRLRQTHGEQPCRLESDSRLQCARVCVIFHTCSLGEGARGAGEGAYLHSLWVFGFLKEKNRHSTGSVRNQGLLSPSVVLKRHQQSEAGEKSDSILWGWECPPGSFKRFSFLLPSACHWLTVRLPSTRLGGRVVHLCNFKNLFWVTQVYNPHAKN